MTLEDTCCSPAKLGITGVIGSVLSEPARYGVELGKNGKEHGIKVHGSTEEKWNEEMSKNLEHF